MVGQPLVVTVVSVLLGTGTPGTQAGDPILDEWHLPSKLDPPSPLPEPPKAPATPRPPEAPAPIAAPKAPAVSRPALTGRRPSPSFPPPDPRLTRGEVIFPALIGVGLGLTSGLFYKFALDQSVLLETNTPKTRSEVEQITRTGNTHQTVSLVLGGAAVASVGASVVMYLLAPETKPAEPKVSLLPTPGGAVVGITGVLP